MKCIYVAGRYSAVDDENVMDILGNIRNGIAMATRLLKLGYAPFCPWLDHQFVLYDPDLEVGHMYRYSMAFLTRCDAVLMLPEWKKSKGATAEYEMAMSLNIPVYDTVADLLHDISPHDVPPPKSI